MDMNVTSAEVKRRLRNRESMFLRRLFGILSKMANADRKVDRWEIHVAEKAFERFPRAMAKRKTCARYFNESRDGRIPLYEQAREFSDKWATPEDCLVVYELLWDIACATYYLRPVHKEILRGICRFLKLPSGYFEIYYRRRSGTFREWAEKDNEQDTGRRQRETQKEFRDSPPPPVFPETPLERAYALLGCRPSDGLSQLHHAYRLVAKRCHPDLLRSNGGSDQQVREATEMMSKVNAAWELIQRARQV